MRRSVGVLLAMVLVAGMATVAAASAAQPADPARVPPARDLHGPGPVSDVGELPRFARVWRNDKQQAADLVALGTARPNRAGVLRLPNGRFVDHVLEREDHVVTILAEFDDPIRGQLPEPDRSVDNSTYWVPRFDRRHYRDMLFTPGGGSYGRNSMRDNYVEMSSGRYAVTGQVSRWLHIPAPESEFGANGSGPGSDDRNGPVGRIVKAALRVTKGVDEGLDWSPALVDTYDRYDCDADGVFDEPDGYVDHVQLVHAGAGEEAGGGAQGGAAIWSHKGYAAWWRNAGPEGCAFGGYRVPGTDLWVGDYTIHPEDGASGVFTHEFGHDLGLPDHYDWAGGYGNSANHWTVMGSSWPSASADSIGDDPYHMGAWDKLILGWSDLVRMGPGEEGRVRLGPGEGSSTVGAQALRIDLPDYRRRVRVVDPEGGDRAYYYSGQGNDLRATMRHSLGRGLGERKVLRFRANVQIERDWDYAYVEISRDGGDRWRPVNGSLSTSANPNGQNEGFGITGKSRGWVDATYTIPVGATDVRFRYRTDGAVSRRGLAVDSIRIGARRVDDATGPSAWELRGFARVRNGIWRQRLYHYYLIESRSYVRQDANLCGIFRFLTDSLVERFCNARGLLVWYRDSGYGNNNVSGHPGRGSLLVVDSHPEAVRRPDTNGYWSGSIQAWDAPFGVDDERIVLHTRRPDGSLRPFAWDAPAQPVFDDSRPGKYYDPAFPWASVITPGSGVRVTILDASAKRTAYDVRVRWLR